MPFARLPEHRPPVWDRHLDEAIQALELLYEYMQDAVRLREKLTDDELDEAALTAACLCEREKERLETILRIIIREYKLIDYAALCRQPYEGS